MTIMKIAKGTLIAIGFLLALPVAAVLGILVGALIAMAGGGN